MNLSEAPGHSKHAISRCQQRAISPLMVDLTLKFGRREPAGFGTVKVYLDKRGQRRALSYAGPHLAASLRPHLDTYVLLGEQDVVVTVGHRLSRIQRDLKRP